MLGSPQVVPSLEHRLSQGSKIRVLAIANDTIDDRICLRGAVGKRLNDGSVVWVAVECFNNELLVALLVAELLLLKPPKLFHQVALVLCLFYLMLCCDAVVVHHVRSLKTLKGTNTRAHFHYNSF